MEDPQEEKRWEEEEGVALFSDVSAAASPDKTAAGSEPHNLVNPLDAAANEAERQAPHRYLTVAMDQIAFHAPVRVGDIVTLWAETLSMGRTSIRVRVKVLARARRSPHENEVTTAEVTMVAVDEAGRSIPILS